MIAQRFTKESFTHTVERIVRKDKLTYVEAVIDICAEHEIDPRDAPQLFEDILKQRIKAEAGRLGSTKKTRGNRTEQPRTLF